MLCCNSELQNMIQSLRNALQHNNSTQSYKIENRCGSLVMTILLFSRNNCADFICISFLMHVTELSLKFLPSVSKDFLLLFHNLPNIMVYNKSRPYLILLLLIPFLPCKLYSYDCIYYIYQWHSPLNVKYMWALATLTMHVYNKHFGI